MRRRYAFRSLVATATALAFYALPPLAPVASAQAPPTLTGEGFVVFDGAGSASDLSAFPGTVEINGTCSDTGPSTFTFTVAGTAIGPYPGPFTTTGTFTLVLDPTNPNLPRKITDFSESFTIESPTGPVSGSKRFDPNGLVDDGVYVGVTTNEGYCALEGQPTFRDVAQADPKSSYTARIETPSGTFVDRGSNITSLSQFDASADTPSTFPAHAALFNENFGSRLTAVEPAAPATALECKDGGWRAFGVFKNQGDCVSFVTTGGRNPAAGG